MPKVTTLDGSFESFAHETLLQGLERTGYQVEYQCRSGYCGTCRTKILSGKVSYPEPHMAVVAENEILPCCCKVETDIQIECRKRPVNKGNWMEASLAQRRKNNFRY
ncbi:class I ribonucleotide reductase maintenance protein YfaE [Wielerella bovis]|uniref:class I ribonucleotide reductase maintenance protein YfaE n=1 Tax=Wielerella bovis TaxID=2917790 RepID=UPI002018DE86|nr:class I ribonucleotide reductase maintenance protein YfaE [Wielerella bovis]MCG7657067.1 class I ribonucleotide reductase maintenance protein YfaE [Wielerella bovis]MCG7659290.1 class I ribonucleotide reductase maintenance protein YfaE [Wielerella bovis]ULJ59463.1 class I ribonucleotide reductase maintenance protein YfaE [Wielerella bovis]ULJ61663.1 class I ribonucleotide reductase maintenance protein YfaE [Wielerella bovis]ULJ63789.1 class I ribonucleotide reductase maintenance protein Yfa